jgi:carbonic anhydrase/acetyltransferase-like protein (isoleucine patch superfamily)
MPLIPYKGRSPIISQNCFVAPTAVLIGDVTLHEGASVWFGCVLRGDVAPIVVGARSNIQDNTVIHGDDSCPTLIGEDVTVGHSAIIHAATIADRVLVGMGSVLLSRCKIGSDTIIGARALITEGIEIAAGSLAIGMPARVKRPLTSEEHTHIMASSAHYQEFAWHYMEQQP